MTLILDLLISEPRRVTMGCQDQRTQEIISPPAIFAGIMTTYLKVYVVQWDRVNTLAFRRTL